MNDAVIHEFAVPANHPSLAGHFPGQPVVPGVVLLDAVLAAIRTRDARMLSSIPIAKFLLPVLAGERIGLRLRFDDADAAEVLVNFQGLRDTSLVFEGSFVLRGVSP